MTRTLNEITNEAQRLANLSGEPHVVFNLNGDKEFPFYVARKDFDGADSRPDLVTRVNPIPIKITSDYIVLNEKTLGYFDKNDTKRTSMEILAGYHDWRNGSVPVSHTIDVIRPATLEDFARFRVSYPGSIKMDYNEIRNMT